MICIDTLLDIVKTYTTKTTHDGMLEDAIPSIFDWGGTVSAWDNDKVPESKQKTTTEITALNTALAYELKKAICLEYINYCPCMKLDAWKWGMHARWNREIQYFNDAFQIYLDKYEWRTFEDYHIYHEGTTEGETTGSSTTSETGTAETTTGDYPNAGTTAYATGIQQTSTTGSGTASTSGTAETSDTWEEYRIGATGQTPIDLQKNAYDVIVNLTKEFVLLFADLFVFDIQHSEVI